MTRLIHHAIVIAVVALQVLALPALSAPRATPHSAAASSSCPDQMGQGDHSCPCCPDGIMVAGCMSLCTAFATGSGIAITALQPVPAASIPFDPIPVSTQTYAPLDPPPIR